MDNRTFFTVTRNASCSTSRGTVFARLRSNLKVTHCRRGNSTSASAQAETTPQTLSWSEYLQIRGKKRKWEMVRDIVTDVLSQTHLPQFTRLQQFHVLSSGSAGVPCTLVRRRLTLQSPYSFVIHFSITEPC